MRRHHDDVRRVQQRGNVRADAEKMRAGTHAEFFGEPFADFAARAVADEDGMNGFRQKRERANHGVLIFRVSKAGHLHDQRAAGRGNELVRGKRRRAADFSDVCAVGNRRERRAALPQIPLQRVRRSRRNADDFRIAAVNEFVEKAEARNAAAAVARGMLRRDQPRFRAGKHFGEGDPVLRGEKMDVDDVAFPQKRHQPKNV